MDLKLKGKKSSSPEAAAASGAPRSKASPPRVPTWPFFSRNADQVKDTVESLQRAGGSVFGEAFEITDQDSYRD